MRNRPRKINILERKIHKRNIPRPTLPSPASIRRETLILPRPRLDSSRIPGIHTSNIRRRDIFNNFNLARILSDATHGESLTVVKSAIGNINICGILFHADAIVAVVDCPAEKCDVVGVHGIDAVGVDVGAKIAIAVGAGGVDVNVLEENLFGAGDCHGPHLGLEEVEAFDDGVFGVGDEDGMRSAVEVAFAFVVVVPDLAVAVQSSMSVAVEVEVLAAEMPGCGLVLEADGHGVCEPIWYVCVPEHGASELHGNVLESRRVHFGTNVVSRILEDNVSVLSTVVKCLDDGGSIIALGIIACRNMTGDGPLRPRLIM